MASSSIIRQNSSGKRTQTYILQSNHTPLSLRFLFGNVFENEVFLSVAQMLHGANENSSSHLIDFNMKLKFFFHFKTVFFFKISSLIFQLNLNFFKYFKFFIYFCKLLFFDKINRSFNYFSFDWSFLIINL